MEKPSNNDPHFKKGRTEASSTVLLIDADGLSHYTSYLAYGLAKYKKIILCGLSYDDYVITGAIKEKKIKFYNMGERLPQRTSIISKIITYPLTLFVILLKLLITTNYDIVHFQGHIPLFFLFIPILKLKARHICWTIHDVDLRPGRRGISGNIELFYMNMVTQFTLLVKYVDSIIVHGTLLKSQLEAKGVDTRKISVIPHMDYRYLTEVDNTKLKDESLFRDYILLFGRIKPYKGIEVLINAVRLARKLTSHKFNILISGKGEISYLTNSFDSQDYEYIQICNNFVPYSRIPSLFRKAKFLVLPYIEGSQSGILPLAYTFSKPVIVSNVGSLAEFVDNDKTGFVFKCGDVMQLATYIVKLVEDNCKCKEMGKNAHEKLLREMSLEKCCEIINRIYMKLE